ncbi:AAA family ATPase [Actinomycetospora chiangmaiensis]|uniref:AAA family ATPase n=1 Tax=Actinomycetospora chiangmaiensis TaxID=402650 RepID=UPI000377DD09|nr:AAA family ATPase [Actinomycetospora chiangmaiensis]
MPEVVLLIGLQACGKTTFYTAELAATHALVSKDAMPRSARRKEDRQQRELTALLAAGRDVCIDNTQPSAAERAGVIAVARTAGARVVGHWWRPDLPLSVARNAGRAEPVPLVGLYAASARWEEPRLDEGFDELVVHTS